MCTSVDLPAQARVDNLLLLGAINFQLRNFSESIFYNQQVRQQVWVLK